MKIKIFNLKRIKYSILYFILTIIYPSVYKRFNKDQIKQINLFKQHFKLFFGGVDNFVDPEIPIPISRFMITNFKYKFTNKTKNIGFNKYNLIVTIVLARPGLLIGKAGETIDKLNSHLAHYNIKVDIEESKLWNNHINRINDV